MSAMFGAERLHQLSRSAEEMGRNDRIAILERIDHVFGNFAGYEVDKIKVEVVGDDPYDKTPSGLWPSDHAGVAAKISFEK